MMPKSALFASACLPVCLKRDLSFTGRDFAMLGPSFRLVQQFGVVGANDLQAAMQNCVARVELQHLLGQALAD